jgi:hypothetical protein
MLPSRGMGDINPSKMPGKKTIHRKDHPEDVEMYKSGGLASMGLYANIHAKQKRIKAGSKEKMRKPGSKGAPTKQDFIESAKTRRSK